MKAKLPILVLAYNRPDLVAKVMHVIQVYKPIHLYLACDGPRMNKEGDANHVSDTRETMLNAVNWDCEVHTLFRVQNRGCAYGVYEAISWFFEHEEYGIILEDDVLVSQDFFKLCEDLLPRYKNEDRIMQISSRNTSGRNDISNTYIYSQLFHCCGWATWRRAWHYMDMTMAGMRQISLIYLIRRIGILPGIIKYYRTLYKYKHIERYKAWAARWDLSILARDGIGICPGVNLSENIGMDAGEHYSSLDTKRPEALVRIESIAWPIKYNDTMQIDRKQKYLDIRTFWKERWFGLKKKIKLAVGRDKSIRDKESITRRCKAYRKGHL